jgi:signal transduction histidine kinase
MKSVGGPMPGGGYLTSFTDVTREVEMRGELEHMLEELENRVTARTRELSEANHRLAESTRDKTRFLAAASHDLLQPLHAARLFLAALDRQAGKLCVRWLGGLSGPSVRLRPCSGPCLTFPGSMPGNQPHPK